MTIGAESMALSANVTTYVVFAMEGIMMLGILLGYYLTERRYAV
jgi:ABC-type uncharacterized transport system permease subunit